MREKILIKKFPSFCRSRSDGEEGRREVVALRTFVAFQPLIFLINLIKLDLGNAKPKPTVAAEDLNSNLMRVCGLASITEGPEWIYQRNHIRRFFLLKCNEMCDGFAAAIDLNRTSNGTAIT